MKVGETKEKDERRDSKDGKKKDDKKDRERREKKEKKKMVTVDPFLLLSFVYFDQTHTGYIIDRDLEDIINMLGLNLSRAQVCVGKRSGRVCGNNTRIHLLSCLYLY